jgi:hypothetical protein
MADTHTFEFDLGVQGSVEGFVDLSNLPAVWTTTVTLPPVTTAQAKALVRFYEQIDQLQQAFGGIVKIELNEIP